ncbi:MAG: glucosamine-6-phosphate deaminase [Bacteroidota bacterium]
MIKKVYKDYKELSTQTALQIARIITEKPDALLCFPAGETSLGTFDELVKLQKNGQANFSRCKIVGLDEWVNLGVMKNENCYHFLKSHLFDRIDVNQENVCFFNGEADDLQRECAITDQFIKSIGGIDLMLLGVGMNGHLGLNEPGTSFDKYSHIVELDEVTKNVGQKYFSVLTNLLQGITLGMKHVMESKTVIVQLSGSRKSPIVKRLLETEISTNFPASLIRNHPNAFLLLDSEASELL